MNNYFKGLLSGVILLGILLSLVAGAEKMTPEDNTDKAIQQIKMHSCIAGVNFTGIELKLDLSMENSVNNIYMQCEKYSKE